MQLVRLFIKINIIKYIQRVDRHSWMIFLNSKLTTWLHIENKFTPSKLVLLRKNELNSLLKLKSKLFLISSSNGVFIANSSSNTGGILVSTIYFN